MNDIQVTISNLISSQFPEVYRDEGPTLVSFVEAYFEWLEQNFQLLTLENNTGFEVGSKVRQGNVTGTVIANIDGDLLVKVDSNDSFSCYNNCASSLMPIETLNGEIVYSSLVKNGGTTKRLGSIFQARNLQNYRDIDSTIDLFIGHFKEKYLSNLDFDALSNKKLLIKNALSLYRSKGTERSIDLFFRLVYGVNAEVKRPSDFLFQASGAEWVKPTYLEISPDTVQRAISLVGKEVTGVTSGATAFVERYIKLKTKNGYSHILFVSNVKGSFLIRELLKDEKVFEDSPIVYGSLSSVDITVPAAEFKIGDIVDLNSTSGINGLGRVVEVRFASGQIEFLLEDKGYGYSVNLNNSSPTASKTLVADHLLTLSNVDYGNVASFAVITNPGTGYSNNDIVTFDSNFGRNAKAVVLTNGSGQIQQLNFIDRGSGFIFPIPDDITFNIATTSGTGASFICNTDYPTEGIRLLEPVTQPGNIENPEGVVLSMPSTITLSLSNIQGAITEGDTLYQKDPTRGVVASGTIIRLNVVLNEGLVVLSDIQGVFRKKDRIYNNGGSFATVVGIESISFPIKLTTSSRFLANSEFLITTEQCGLKGSTGSVSVGQNASLSVASIEYPETIIVNTDLLSEQSLLETRLNATSFGLPANPTSNVSSFLFDSLTFNEITIGKVRSIGGFNPGEGYSTSPEVLLYQPYVAPFDKRDLTFKISNLSGSFIINELVEQATTINVREIGVSNSSIFSVGEPITITDNIGTIVDSGIIFKIPDNNKIQLRNITTTGSFTGLSIRSQINEASVLTINSSTVLSVNLISRGLVKSFNSNELQIQRLSFSNSYVTGSNFVGTISGVTATVTSIDENVLSKPIGLNSVVSSSTISSNGSIASLQVIDSGFGFIDGQEGTFISPTGEEGKFTVSNGGLGIGSGSYRSVKGFASSQSKLFDGDYYQEYSYDILSKIPISKYGQMFKEVMHTAGTRFFGSVVLDSEIKVSEQTSSSSSEIIVTEISPFTINSTNIDSSPAPWGSTVIGNPNLRADLAPVVDFDDINIEIRD